MSFDSYGFGNFWRISRSGKAPLVPDIQYKEAHPAIIFNMAFVCLSHFFLYVQINLNGPHCYAQREAVFNNANLSRKIFFSTVDITVYILLLTAIAASLVIIMRQLKDQNIPFSGAPNVNFRKISVRKTI